MGRTNTINMPVKKKLRLATNNGWITPSYFRISNPQLKSDTALAMGFMLACMKDKQRNR